MTRKLYATKNVDFTISILSTKKSIKILLNLKRQNLKQYSLMIF